MDHKTFQRALGSLSHPVAIAAIALLLVNDHVLKPYVPSWWTGKLSDAAWLVVMPLVIAALMALIIPRRAGHVIGPLAFLMSVWCFVLLKASPETNQLLLGLVRQLTGIPWTTASDPTDLLVLPTIGIGWHLWTRSQYRESRPSAGRWMALSAATLALLADAPAPFHAIACLRQEGDTIVAYSDFGNEFYVSTDGGISWQNASPGSNDPQSCAQHESTWEIVDPGNEAVRYRLVYGEGIDRSTDGGKTWQREIALTGDEARVYYYHKFYSYAAGAGPYDAVFDARTGNLVVAMGFDGALVRDARGQWIPVAVGEYHREVLSSDMILSLLSGEIWLAVAVAVLMVGLLNRAAFGFRRWDVVLSVLSWGIWGFAVLLSPASLTGSGDYLSLPMLGASTILAVVGGIISLVVGKIWTRRVPGLLRIALISLCGALLFVMPYLLWAQGTIVGYQTAQIAGLVMVIILLASSIAVMFRNRKTSQTPDASS